MYYGAGLVLLIPCCVRLPRITETNILKSARFYVYKSYILRIILSNVRQAYTNRWKTKNHVCFIPRR